MDGREGFRIAVRSVRAHKLRSALTIVGIVIGIASVITFATFGASVQAEIIGDIGDSNAGNIYVFGTPADDDDGFDRVLQPVFTESDLAAISEKSTGSTRCCHADQYRSRRYGRGIRRWPDRR